MMLTVLGSTSNKQIIGCSIFTSFIHLSIIKRICDGAKTTPKVTPECCYHEERRNQHSKKKSPKNKKKI